MNLRSLAESSVRPLGGIRPMLIQDEDVDSMESSRNLIVDLFMNSNSYELDLTFRVFSLPVGRFRVWSGDSHRLFELEEHLNEAKIRLSDDQSVDRLLYEVLDGLGFRLHMPVQKIKLAGSEIFSIGKGEILICLDAVLSIELIEAMVEEVPDMILCLDDPFQHDSSLAQKRVKSSWK